ncbi:integrase [Burkholderia sp. WAC0059]|uniref:phage integrase n=1 Tax=Burkholderia sp. WAC0059 TaxID=2066022 RepID=UPI000C7EF620|nr:tyrosine-type recombinase/integrase [Burkholderia sp. WAC0059]PLZ02463.1 integrase [Burkholderia sp. WAC0059]
MTIKQVLSGWQVDIQPGGRGARRLKKTFPTKAEAEGWKRYVLGKVQEAPEWMPARKDPRRLSELVELWFVLHGSGLNAGEDTKSRLLQICRALGDPRADLFTTDMFAEYRSKRLAEGITQNNMNREHAYMRAMFNELKRLKKWKLGNPLSELRAFKIQDTELSYLTLEQIRILLEELQKSKNVHVMLISKVCLATGARWGEAERLRMSQVRSGVIQFVKTKSSKARGVPVTRELERMLRAHRKSHGEGDRIFGSAWSAFREAVERAKIVLPKGQLTHVLRHTFASHFMMNGGNILSLQRALGHHSLAMTMRYAHLSPEHLAETRHLNPLARLDANAEERRSRQGRTRRLERGRRTPAAFAERLAASREVRTGRARLPLRAVMPGIAFGPANLPART